MTPDFENAVLQRLERAPGRAGTTAGPGCVMVTAPGPGRPENQDRAALCRFADGGAVAVIADGMGGMADGGGCAAQAVAALIAWLAANGCTPDRAALAHANRHVLERRGGTGGSTLTAVVMPATGRPWLAHAGDSRAHALSEADGVRQLSHDHNALAEVGSDVGTMAPLDRLRLGAQITRAVGLEDELMLPWDHVSGTEFLLTTDGIHDYGAVAAHVGTRGQREPHEATAALLEAARRGGSHDDATAVYIDADRLPDTMNGTRIWFAGDSETPMVW